MPLAYFKRLPRLIKFEATNVCNLRCPVCPTHFAITRDRGYMDTALFKSVIDEFEPFKKKPRVTFKSLSMGSYTDREKKLEYEYLLPKTKHFLRKRSAIQRTLCRRPFWEAVIYWDGTLGLCCVDFNGACRMPNITNQDFIRTWRRNVLLKIRKQGFLKHHTLCKSCSLGAADWGGFSVDLK